MPCWTHHASIVVVLAESQGQVAQRLRARLHRHGLVVREPVLLREHKHRTRSAALRRMSAAYSWRIMVRGRICVDTCAGASLNSPFLPAERHAQSLRLTS